MIVTLGQQKKGHLTWDGGLFFLSQEQLEVRDWMAGWLAGFVVVVVVIIFIRMA